MKTRSLVQLPAGKFVVLAEAENSGMVGIAVIITPGQLTKVDLQSDWKHRAPSGNAADWVRLPNGQVVGWRATAAGYPSPSGRSLPQESVAGATARR